MGQTYSSTEADVKAVNDTNAHSNMCDDYSTSSAGEDDCSFREPDSPLLDHDDCRSPIMNDLSYDGGSSITSSVDSDDESLGDSSVPSKAPRDIKQNSILDVTNQDSGSNRATNDGEDTSGTVEVIESESSSPESSPNRADVLVENLSDLLSLENSKIKARLENATFTIESIQSADKIVNNSCIISDEDIYSWYQEKNDTTINTKTGFVTANSSRKSHMEMALFILKQAPSLKVVRFKMVPAKIKEAPFWNAVFYLLLTEEEQQLMTVNLEIEAANSADSQSKMDAGRRSETLDKLVVRKNKEIAKLKGTIAQLEQRLKEANSRSQGSDSAEPDGSIVHKGTWVRHKESLEFQALDDELKQKLREGKEKRLQDVRDQMVFILDSDDIKDSRGKWDCCSKTQYTEPCSS